MHLNCNLLESCGRGSGENVCLCIGASPLPHDFISQYPEVPELRIYKFWEEPIGPHPIAMFEVNLFTPAQFGAFIPWLVINRGPLSALVHPNCVDPVTGNHEEEYRDHTQRATWLGREIPLDLSLFHLMAERKRKAAEAEGA
jgi:aromatic ring-cleaving dioxygenase